MERSMSLALMSCASGTHTQTSIEIFRCISVYIAFVSPLALPPFLPQFTFYRHYPTIRAYLQKPVIPPSRPPVSYALLLLERVTRPAPLEIAF